MSPRKKGIDWNAHWRHYATKRFVCSVDATLCQITSTTCLKYIRAHAPHGSTKLFVACCVSHHRSIAQQR